ncbi:MAG TPA: hypothetical protein VK211_01330 [Kamptonema sp.]|nr:hypothetical protein [Kamptonema sp.]
MENLEYVNDRVFQNTVRDNHKPRSPLTFVRLEGIKPVSQKFFLHTGSFSEV